MQPARVQTFRKEVPIIAALNSWLNILNNIKGRSKAAADQKITGLHLEESTAVHSLLLLHHHRLPYHTSRVPLRSVGAGSTEDRCTVRTPFYTPSDSATWSGVVPGPGMPGVSNRRPSPPEVGLCSVYLCRRDAATSKRSPEGGSRITPVHQLV
jgi:hypothetical protein